MLPPMDNIPPMEGNETMEDMPMDDQAAMPPTDGNFDNELPMDGNSEENPFDTNFDAGVDANEETDPKRYIQQLTGKLSQSLNQYNGDLPQSDTDLNKYVAGMILKQTTKGLSQDDVNDILDNMKNDEITNECKTSYKTKIDEIFNEVIQNNEDEGYSEPINDIGFRKKPFTSPRFH